MKLYSTKAIQEIEDAARREGITACVHALIDNQILLHDPEVGYGSYWKYQINVKNKDAVESLVTLLTDRLEQSTEAFPQEYKQLCK